MNPNRASRRNGFFGSWTFAMLTVFGLIVISVVIGLLWLHHLVFPAMNERKAAVKPSWKQSIDLNDYPKFDP